MNRLILTIGLPRSGKSTWARAQGHPMVNPDSIRLAITGKRYEALAEPFVWATAKAMVRSLFYAGHEVVILDATNTTVKRRDEWIDPLWAREFHEIDTNRTVCLNRTYLFGDDDYVSGLISTINRMADGYEPFAIGELRPWELANAGTSHA
jgi:predicted kinase